MVAEDLREVEELRDQLAVILLIIQETFPLVLKAEENAIRVVEVAIDFDEVVSEWLHPN